MRSFALIALTATACLSTTMVQLSAQGYYSRTVVRSPVTGRQQIVDNHRPRWTGDGKGGFMFDGATGSLQVTAVRRNRFTGRLEYHNQFINPWTGARYSTGTTFNPFTGRYQTLHNFVPPPAQEDASQESDVVTNEPRSRRGIRVIETQSEIEEPPGEVAPPVELSQAPNKSSEAVVAPATTIKIITPE